MDAASQEALLEIYVREARSLLIYLRAASPYLTAQQRPLHTLAMALSADEEKQLGKIVRSLVRNHILPPPLDSYPEQFMDLNFLTLEHLLAMVLDEQKERVRLLETTIPNIADETARALAQEYLALKLRHILKLDAALTEQAVAPVR